MDYHPPLRIQVNHLCALLSPGDWLIDTGSPVSFGETAACLPCATHPVAKSHPYLSLADLRGYVGTNVVGLLGGDILNSYEMLFDLPGQKLGIAKSLPGNSAGTRVPLRFTDKTIPILEARIEDQGAVPMIFDTGAQYSYLTDLRGNDLRPIGRARDFHAALGVYEVELHLKRVRVGNADMDIQFAYHPKVAEMCLQRGTRGILGWEILRHGPVAYLPRRGELWI